MILHTLAGLPRSGSTLLGNVLAQHPDVHVSGTSALEACVEAVVGVLSNSPEVTSDLANVPGAYDNYLSAIRAFADGWYGQRTETHVVDKSRGWSTRPSLLRQLYSDSALIVSVRDPRDVVASIERENRKTAVFNSPVAPTIYEAADILMKPDGMVGGPIRFIENLLRSSTPAVYVRYESLVIDPASCVTRVASAMGLEPHTFDYENVVNIATDLDAIYRYKYPHKGEGAIKSTGTNWRDVFDESLGNLIAGAYPLYMQTFSY